MAKEKKKKRGAGTKKTNSTRPSLPKDKGGRPKEKVSNKVDYNQVAFLCQKGFTDKELGQFYGKAESTIRRWKKDTQFKNVLETNKRMHDELIINALRQRAMGMTVGEGTLLAKMYPPDVEAIKFWLINRQGQDWRIKQEMDIPGTIKIAYAHRKKKKG